MSHPDESTLDRYRTGELGAAEAAETESHLESCEACRGRLAELGTFADRMREAYAASEEAAPEPDWEAQRDSVLSRLDASRAPGVAGAEEAGASDPVVPGPWARVRRWAPQAAAAAIAILVVGVLWNEGIREPEDAARAVRSPEAERVERAAGPPPRETASGAEVETGAAIRERALERDTTGRRAPGVGEEPTAAPAPADAAQAKAGAAELEDEARVEEPTLEAAGRELGEQRIRSDLDAVATEPAERFENRARRALADRDVVRARSALDLFRDSVDVEALEPARADTLDSLADSLAALLGALPR